MGRKKTKKFTMRVLTWSKGGKHNSNKLTHLITYKTRRKVF